MADIPVLEYADFRGELLEMLRDEHNHCVQYFAWKNDDYLHFICAVARDVQHDIVLMSHRRSSEDKTPLTALTKDNHALHIFEREIHENFDVPFDGHPWLKPVRYAYNRANQTKNIDNYPFYNIESHELHEVGVGPIHAGIIEPGHFRFLCNGEDVLHLEIQLGWQHRGIEQLMIQKKKLLQRTILSENIAGDTAIGHSLAFVSVAEALSKNELPGTPIYIERALALELERIAVHVGDISALCTDVAYHFGANVFAALRTGIINFLQQWCGNRFGKGLIRVGGTHFPFTAALRDNLLSVLDDFEKRFLTISDVAFHLPSVENRFDNIGTISSAQALAIGAVGMAARMAGVPRDIRHSHPASPYDKQPISPVLLAGGDVFARFLLRRKEIKQSLKWIRTATETLLKEERHDGRPAMDLPLQKALVAISLVEGWRGEICHCAITDAQGRLVHYKVKDPSMHNWKALELSLRNLEISDFPINNKSYNLSYCGHDL